MAKTLQIKRGSKSTLPTLSQGEFGFVTDGGAEELHIGNGTSNVEIARKDYVDSALNSKQDTLTFDTTPTSGSTKPVTSGGIYTALSGKQGTLTFDTTPTSGSTKPVTSGGIYTALSGKQGTLTFDTTPTSGSTKPVTSGGIYSAIASVTSAGTGAAYTATVPTITALTAGVGFVMVPHTESTTTAPTLNVNGLGAKTIRRRLSTVTGTTVVGYATTWLGSGNPIHVIYNGTYWVVQGMEKPNAYDLSGITGVSYGGTGYSSIADTTYTTARYRASALYDTETTPSTNGVINWTYE